MDRVVELLIEIRLVASEECRRGEREACRVAEEAEEALRRLLPCKVCTGPGHN